MTRRTAAGRRTLNVPGQLTANSPSKRLPQRTRECAGKDRLRRKIMVSLELMCLRIDVNLSVQSLKNKNTDLNVFEWVRRPHHPFYLNSYNHYIPNKQTARTFHFFLH